MAFGLDFPPLGVEQGILPLLNFLRAYFAVSSSESRLFNLLYVLKPQKFPHYLRKGIVNG